MLQEAILNLLNNALVHGGASLSEIHVTLSVDQNNALLCVKDDGVGIPSDQFIQAISRFSQTNGGPGSGLGLPIAARVMENHGGTLEIMESAKGVFIKATLPLDRSSGGG